MLDAKTLCSVTMLPTAAEEPVANKRRPGRYAKNGNVVSPWELQRRRLERHQNPPAKQELLGARKVGDVVMVWQSYSQNSNNGRLGVIHEQSDAFGKEILAWYVTPLGTEFDRGGNPNNGKVFGACFRDQWLLPVAVDTMTALRGGRR